MDHNSNSSIYYEALWVLSLFAATATLREAFGELCVHRISRSILSSTHVSGKTLDVFASCSNNGRSLGFGAAWRMWNIDNSGIIDRRIIVLPFCCWMIGMPIKLVAVQAVRGGNPLLGSWGTWALGILWILVCIFCKLVTIYVDRFHGLKDSDDKILSYRKIFQARFCTFEGLGVMISPQDYDETESFLHPKPKGQPLGVDLNWNFGTTEKSLKLTLRRNGVNDATPNGLAVFQHKPNSLLLSTHEDTNL